MRLLVLTEVQKDIPGMELPGRGLATRGPKKKGDVAAYLWGRLFVGQVSPAAPELQDVKTGFHWVIDVSLDSDGGESMLLLLSEHTCIVSLINSCAGTNKKANVGLSHMKRRRDFSMSDDLGGLPLVYLQDMAAGEQLLLDYALPVKCW